MNQLQIVVNNKVGLHARPAALFVKTANKYHAQVTVRNVTRNSKTVSAKSILGILTLAVLCGHEIYIEADGPDADDVIADLRLLIESNFPES